MQTPILFILGVDRDHRHRGEGVNPQMFQFGLSENLQYFDSATLRPRISGGPNKQGARKSHGMK